MKKIPLAIFLLVFQMTLFYSQPNINVLAPAKTGSTTAVAPIGLSSQAYMRGCFLITATELSALTSTLINSFGFSFVSGANSPVNGTLTLYMENTNDLSYSKGTIWSSAIGPPMTIVYNGNMSLPTGTAGVNASINLTAPFVYNGGGLYVAYDWACTGPYATTYARYASNSSTVVMGAFRSSSTNSSILSSLISCALRPVCNFGATNNATYEAGVVSITAPGKVAESIHSPHSILAQVKNMSIGPLTSVSVKLNVSGANNFADTQVIPNIAAGAVAEVTFAPFDPNLLGINTIAVSLLADNNNNNNNLLWTQDVTCHNTSNSPPGNIGLGGVGFQTGSGIMSTVFQHSKTTTLTAVNLGIAYDFNADQKPVCAVLLDGLTGNIIATTNTITLNTAIMNTTQTFTFSTAKVLNANHPYNIGMAQPQPGYFPLSYAPADAQYAPGRFFSSPITGGGYNIESLGYYMIEPIFEGPEIIIAQASTVICNGQAITLTADGANTYTWTSSIFNPVDNPNNNEITVRPDANEIYTVTATDEAGCVGTAKAPVAVKLCLGLEGSTIENSGLALYPNPSPNGIMRVTGLSQNGKLTVYNVLGQALVTKQVENTSETEIDLSHEAPGNYIIRIVTDQGTETMKFVNQPQ